MKDYPTPPDGLVVEPDGAVLRLRLDRPDRRNAITDDMVLALIETIEAAGSDECGAGDRAHGHRRALLLRLRPRPPRPERRASRAPARRNARCAGTSTG